MLDVFFSFSQFVRNVTTLAFSFQQTKNNKEEKCTKKLENHFFFLVWESKKNGIETKRFARKHRRGDRESGRGRGNEQVKMYKNKYMYSSSETLTKIRMSTTEYVNRKFEDGMKRYYKFCQDNLIRSLNLYHSACGTKTIIIESITSLFNITW